MSKQLFVTRPQLARFAALACLLISSACSDLAKDEHGNDAGAGDGGMLPSGDGGPDHDAAQSGDGAIDMPAADGGGMPVDPNAPKLSVDFPMPGLTQLSSLHVRGHVVDPKHSAIVSVTVHGVSAKLSGDAWSATVPLSMADNELTPTATNAAGLVGQGAKLIVTRVGAQLETPYSFAYDAANKRVIVLDASDEATGTKYALYQIELASKKLTLLSGRGRGTGPELGRPTQLALDSTGTRCFVLEPDTAAVLAIDLSSGNRSVFSNATTPDNGGPMLTKPTDLVWDAAGKRLIVSDYTANALFSIDGSSGVRSQWPNPGGPALGDNALLAYDVADDVVYAGNHLSPQLLKIGSDGTRTVVAGYADNQGYDFGDFEAIAFDVKNHRLLMRDGYRVVELDLATLHRRWIVDLRRPSDPDDLTDLMGLAVDASTGDVLAMLADTAELVLAHTALDPAPKPLFEASAITSGNLAPLVLASQDDDYVLLYDPRVDKLLRVSLHDGSSSVVSDAAASGLHFNMPRHMVYDSVNDRALVLESEQLYAVDLKTGARSVISRDYDNPVGSGPLLNDDGISDSVDLTNNRVITAADTALLAVDLGNGNRSEFSGAGRGAGTLPASPRALSYEYNTPQYLFVGSDAVVVGVDPSTGDRTTLSGGGKGTGPAFSNLQLIVADEHEQTAIVYDQVLGIVSVELGTGNRRVLQTPTMIPAAMVHDAGRGRVVLAVDNTLVTLEIVAHGATTAYAPAQRGSLWSSTSFVNMEKLSSGQADMLTPTGITSFALGTGVTKITSGLGVADGLTLATFFDTDADRIYGVAVAATQSQVSSLYAVDLKSGDRTRISGGAQGTGSAWGFPYSGAVDTKRKRVLVLDSGAMSQLVAVDPITGNRTQVSGDSVGSGDNWMAPTQVRYDAAGDRALVLEADHVVAVNLTTGDRTILSGAGPTLSDVRGLVIDAVGKRAIVRDVKLGGFVSIDLATGARKMMVPDPTIGPFPQLFGSWPFDIDYDATQRTLFGRDLLHPQRGLLQLDELTGDTVTVLGRTP